MSSCKITSILGQHAVPTVMRQIHGERHGPFWSSAVRTSCGLPEKIPAQDGPHDQNQQANIGNALIFNDALMGCALPCDTIVTFLSEGAGSVISPTMPLPVYPYWPPARSRRERQANFAGGVQVNSQIDLRRGIILISVSRT